MKAGFGLSIAAAIAAFVAVDAAAQTAPAPRERPSIPEQTAPQPSDTVGPRELRDFTLGGTPPRTTEAPAADAPARAEPAPTERSPATAAPQPARTESRRSAPRESAPSAAPVVSDTRGREPDIAPAASAPIERPFTQPSPAIPGPVLSPDADSRPAWPWMLALAAALIGAGVLLFRQRARRNLALADGDYAPQPRFEAPPPPPPVPAPASSRREPVPSPAGGLVSTRLRPWIDLQFAPSRCIFSEDGATIEFTIGVANSGTASARDLLVETKLFNAGPEQDEEIAGFFAHPFAKGEAIAELPPLKGIELRSSVSLPMDRLRILEAGGRRFFVPMIGFTAVYRWAGGTGQTSESFLLGREGREGREAKMAPFRSDLGPRVFRGIGARAHSLQVRR